MRTCVGVSLTGTKQYRLMKRQPIAKGRTAAVDDPDGTLAPFIRSAERGSVVPGG